MKRILSLVLALGLMLTIIVVPDIAGAVAYDEYNQEYDQTEESGEAAAVGINIGDYVQMGTYYGAPILWRCVDIDENGPLMLSDKIICIKPFDVKGEANTATGSHSRDWYRQGAGSNYWADSNMRSWLNSNESAGNVTWLCGNPPDEEHVKNGYNEYDQEAGFLTNFTHSEINAMKEVTQKSLLSYPEIDAGMATSGSELHSYDDYIKDVVANYDNAYAENVTDRMFLLDVKQVNKVYNNGSILGYEYYKGEGAANTLGDDYINAKWNYWLRSPYAGNGVDVRYVSYDGRVYGGGLGAISSGVGVRPAFYLNLSSVIFKSGNGSESNPYTVQGSGGSNPNTGSGGGTVPSHDMPENINNVTINGHGTAFGWFKVLDNNGNPYTNMPVSYRIDGGKASATVTDENGYAGVKIDNIKKSKDYSVEVFGTGIPNVKGAIHVTVDPLAFTSSYEAVVTKGKSAALGIGVGGKIGNLEAEAEAASVGFDAANKKSLSMTQESVNGKTKLTLTASENAAVALSAKAGLFAGAKADGIAGSEMSAGEISGKVSYGSGIGATFKDDDFDIHNSDDIWDLSKFMLSMFLESGDSNMATRYLIKKINAPVDSYTGSSSALLSAGAKLGSVKAGLAGGELGTDLFSINGNMLFTSSTTVDKNSTKYKSGISADAGYKCFDLSFGSKTPDKKDLNAKTGIALKTGGFVDNSVNFGATRNSKGLSQLSLTAIDDSEESIFWKKTSMTSKYTVSYSDSAAQSVAASDDGLKKFSEGKKGFFGINGMQTAANAMMKSGKQGTYNTTYEYKKGIDVNASAGVQLFLKLGLNVGLSGVEGYEYESENGLYDNDTIYLQSQSDIKKDVENKFVGVEDLMGLMTKPITDFVSSCWDTVSGWLDSGVKYGKAAVKKFKNGVKNLWVSITSPKDEIEASAIEAINDETADAASAGIATTLGKPYIVSAESDGVEVNDFSDSPMLLSIEYTQAQLSGAGVTDLNDIAIYKWDADKCVYIRMGGTLDSANSIVELEITKPGQYILAADNMPPAVSAFKSSNSGTGQEITALISDMSGITEFIFSIDGEEKVNMRNLDDYYDSTNGKFAYPVTDIAEGTHTAAIYAADSAGNAMVSPVELSFSVNAAAPVIENLTLPSGTVKNNDNVTAVVSGKNISSVLLNIKETDPLGKETTSSYEMTNQNGEYTALIQGITPGNKTEIWVAAYNTDGNGTESEKTTVLAVSDGSGPEIMITGARNNSVTVTTVNGENIADAEVLLAAYDENGTLKQAEIKAYSPELVFDNIDLNSGEIKAYLWDKDQQPLCGATQLNIR